MRQPALHSPFSTIHSRPSFLPARRKVCRLPAPPVAQPCAGEHHRCAHPCVATVGQGVERFRGSGGLPCRATASLFRRESAACLPRCPGAGLPPLHRTAGVFPSVCGQLGHLRPAVAPRPWPPQGGVAARSAPLDGLRPRVHLPFRHRYADALLSGTRCVLGGVPALGCRHRPRGVLCAHDAGLVFRHRAGQAVVRCRALHARRPPPRLGPPQGHPESHRELPHPPRPQIALESAEVTLTSLKYLFYGKEDYAISEIKYFYAFFVASSFFFRGFYGRSKNIRTVTDSSATGRQFL